MKLIILIVNIIACFLSVHTLIQAAPIDDPIMGEGQIIVIIDTGVQKTHEEFIDPKTGKSRVIEEACFSTNSSKLQSLCPNGQEVEYGPRSAFPSMCNVSGCDHGTHVAGIAAGKNYGVAPRSKIFAVQVFSKVRGCTTGVCITTTTENVESALQWVLDKVKTNNIAAVNLSLGDYVLNSEYCNNSNTAKTIKNLAGLGVATVAASGNTAFSDGVAGSWACATLSFTVGNQREGSIHVTSNTSKQVDLLAPGTGIRAAIFDNIAVTNKIGRKTGTSMAAPYVAGSVAVLKAHIPDSRFHTCGN